MTEQSGWMSNSYSYEPLSEQDGIAKQLLGAIGTSLGQAAFSGPIAQNVGGIVGGGMGEQLGVVLDNHESVLSNVQTFLTEINDWRSWSNVMRPSQW